VYKSYQSLWKHIKKYHPIEKTEMSNDVNIIVNTNYSCNYCNKILSCRQSKWVHEKTCKQKWQTVNNQNKYNIEQQIINNDNRKIINLNLTINGVGNESIKDISIEDVKKMLLNISSRRSILNYVQATYFNKELPENHSFCCTNLKSKYIRIIKPETNKEEIDYKLSFYSDLTHKVIDRIDELHKEYINEQFIKDNKESINDLLINNSSFKEKVTNDKLIKWLFSEYEKIAYNNKDLVKATWNGEHNNYPIIRKINKLINEINSTKLFNYTFDKNDTVIKNLIFKITRTYSQHPQFQPI
jgi:hypothetical protein